MAILDTFEARAKEDSGGRVATIYRDLMDQLANAPLATDKAAREAFRTLYAEAESLAFPATTAFLRHQHALLDFTRNHSLGSVDLEILREIDRFGHGDPSYNYYPITHFPQSRNAW